MRKRSLRTSHILPKPGIWCAHSSSANGVVAALWLVKSTNARIYVVAINNTCAYVDATNHCHAGDISATSFVILERAAPAKSFTVTVSLALVAEAKYPVRYHARQNTSRRARSLAIYLVNAVIRASTIVTRAMSRKNCANARRVRKWCIASVWVINDMLLANSPVTFPRTRFYAGKFAGKC